MTPRRGIDFPRLKRPIRWTLPAGAEGSLERKGQLTGWPLIAERPGQMAGPFCALWAQARRAAAHSGGPRPSRPASASLRPRSGRGPSGGPCGPGLGPALPTRRPRGLVLLKVRQGEGGSRPRPLGASLPPPAACGPLPLPTLGGLGAARPARLRRSGKCGGGRRLRRLRSSRRLPLLGGTLPQSKAKPLRGRFAGLALLLPLAGCGVGAPGRPAPTNGGCGALRPSGPGGPVSGQPPRAGPPAALPAQRRLCLR